jgi:hypothetical protein
MMRAMSKQTPVDLERVALAAREQWRQDPQIRAEFLDDEESYVAYRRASAMGIVRILGQKPGESP